MGIKKPGNMIASDDPRSRGGTWVRTCRSIRGEYASIEAFESKEGERSYRIYQTKCIKSIEKGCYLLMGLASSGEARGTRYLSMEVRLRIISSLNFLCVRSVGNGECTDRIKEEFFFPAFPDWARCFRVQVYTVGCSDRINSWLVGFLKIGVSSDFRMNLIFVWHQIFFWIF